MAQAPKTYRITKTKSSMFNPSRTYTQEGTLTELIEAYSYTLTCGASYSHEKGNKKINCSPKSIKTLISNLYNASNNSAANGHSGEFYSYEEI